MFAAACAIARNYTFPIIVSYRHANGECNSGIGSFVVINDEGWFITAFHIVSMMQDLMKEHQKYLDLVAYRNDIEQNITIKPGEKARLLRTHKIPPTAITHVSAWWGGLGVSQSGIGVPEVDLAVGRFDNYNNPVTKIYPQFKDPSKPMDQGTSLCKLGFPLQEIKPIFDEQRNVFDFPAGAIPPPFFPLDGILTRMVDVDVVGGAPHPFHLKYIETSSPGLMGQSGGPTFDVHGAIWAIQSQTMHYPLGFGNNQKGSKQTEYIKNQYLNVGWGIHSETIVGFLKQNGIPFQLSPH